MRNRTVIIAKSWTKRPYVCIWITFGDASGHGEARLDMEFSNLSNAYDFAERMFPDDVIRPPRASGIFAVMFMRGWPE